MYQAPTSAASTTSSPSQAPLETKKGGHPPWVPASTLYTAPPAPHHTLYILNSSYQSGPLNWCSALPLPPIFLHQTTFHKKENLHSSKVLITISSERSNKCFTRSDGLRW